MFGRGRKGHMRRLVGSSQRRSEEVEVATALLPTSLVALIVSFLDMHSLLGQDSPARVSKAWLLACSRPLWS